jgi:hypothetical protein
VKTVTVTHQNSINYGAVLQSYALQRQLSKLGITDEILDLKSANRVYFREMHLGRALPSDIYNNVVNLLYIFRTHKRVCRFKDFVRSSIRMTRHYRTVDEVIQDPPSSDVYVTGSDQTFNTDSVKRKCNFLRFGSEKTPRISYAASMGGRPYVEESCLAEFISDIRAYKSLSVREQCSAAYITKVCNKPCSTHIDPAFLLTADEWSELASKSSVRHELMKGGYILVYPLLYNPLLNDSIRRLRSQTGLRVIVLNPNSRCYAEGDVVIRDAGPLEFLDLFMNARHILTTTYHGVCFAAVFQKQFHTFISSNKEIRINGLLELLGLANRVISQPGSIFEGEIAYDSVDRVIESEREKARQYLMEALGL